MGNHDFTNIGEQIRGAVQDAIDSMDFKQLNRTISDTMSDALDEVHKQLRQDKPQPAPKPRPAPVPQSAPASKPTAAPQSAPVSKPTPGRTSPPAANILVHPPSHVKGILFTVFGSIGLGLSLISLLAALTFAAMVVSWNAIWGLAGLLTVTTGASAILLCSGNSIRAKSARLKLYLREADKKAYCSIRALVGRTGKPEKYVIRDLKKMIRTGILPHAHLDEKHTCLMLNDETYQQYLLSLEALNERTKKEQSAQIQPRKEASEPITQVAKEGRAYLKALRDANEDIPGEIISAKLSRLETIVENIIHVADIHPKQLDEIERFMEYYLPTTVKLVTAYRDFDHVGIKGENIMMAKQEVEQTLDTINQAFERLLDDLYQDEAFDISTDASVLQAMLKKDGFVNDYDFNQ